MSPDHAARIVRLRDAQLRAILDAAGVRWDDVAEDPTAARLVWRIEQLRRDLGELPAETDPLVALRRPGGSLDRARRTPEWARMHARGEVTTPPIPSLLPPPFLGWTADRVLLAERLVLLVSLLVAVAFLVIAAAGWILTPW